MSLPEYTRAAFSSKEGRTAMLGASIIAFLFILLRWQTYDAPLIRDEGEYAYAVQLLKRGLMPYEHSFLQKPPMVIYTYGLADALAPGVFWMPRILAALAVAGATVLLGCIARLEFGRGHAFPTMALFTPMVLMPKLAESTAKPEAFMLLPLLGVFALYALDRHCSWGARAWLLAGFLSAVAVLYKYTAVPLLAALWIWWSIEKWRSACSWQDLLLHCSSACVGFLSAAGVILAPFLLSDGGQHLWDCTVRFNRFYSACGIFGIDGIWFRGAEFWHAWWILFFVPVFVLLKPSARIGFWVAMFAAACVSTHAGVLRQYYLPLTPFWALLCAAALGQLGSHIKDRFPWAGNWAVRSLASIAVITICLPLVPLVGPGGGLAKAKNHNPPFAESLLVARRVAELTTPDDPVYIAGSEPQILYYADRLCPTRFVIAYPFMIPTPLAEEYQAEAIEDLRRHPPAVVVRTFSNASWMDQPGTPRGFYKFLDQMLSQEYEEVGAYIVQKQSGCWVEPLTAERPKGMISLLLYRHKHSLARKPGATSVILARQAHP